MLHFISAESLLHKTPHALITTTDYGVKL